MDSQSPALRQRASRGGLAAGLLVAGVCVVVALPLAPRSAAAGYHRIELPREDVDRVPATVDELVSRVRATGVELLYPLEEYYDPAYSSYGGARVARLVVPPLPGHGTGVHYEEIQIEWLECETPEVARQLLAERTGVGGVDVGDGFVWHRDGRRILWVESYEYDTESARAWRDRLLAN